jgi:G3E family GTPase
MIGGFLGAGKTTAMLRVGRLLAEKGLRVGLITNDQSSGLVDTAVVSAGGFAVEEITGGCFCCRFDSLMAAADNLGVRSAPEVFLAEPVGSCTDLKATVSYPLRRMYGDNYAVAPFSVLLDPERALRVLGLEGGRRFTDKVRYIYEKQLQEADILVINKIDAVERARVSALGAALRERYSNKEIFEISAATGAGVAAWVASITGREDESRADLAIDYAEYGSGEARLGWLNCTASLEAAAFDGNQWVAGVIAGLQDRLHRHDVEIAHLKITLAAAGDGSDLCVANAVSTETPPLMTFRLHGPIETGELILNLRAEGDPDMLRAQAVSALEAAAAGSGMMLTIQHLEHFRPRQPVPTHRIAMA